MISNYASELYCLVGSCRVPPSSRSPLPPPAAGAFAVGCAASGSTSPIPRLPALLHHMPGHDLNPSGWRRCNSRSSNPHLCNALPPKRTISQPSNAPTPPSRASLTSRERNPAISECLRPLTPSISR